MTLRTRTAVPSYAMAALLALGSLAAVAAPAFASPAPTEEPVIELSSQKPRRGLEMLKHWNAIAVDMSGLDHTPGPAGYAEQPGPGRSSRAMAMAHIAMFDAMNSILGGYESYTGIPPAPRGSSVEAAIAQAAHDTLVVLFPSQKTECDAKLEADLSRMMPGLPKSNGIAVGRRAAEAIMDMRQGDGSAHAEPLLGIGYFPGIQPGEWRQDPVVPLPVAMGALWSGVTPFVLSSADQFRVPPPPAMDSAEYAIAYDEVKELGGDGTITPTSRTEEQTHIGIYWAYDGTPSLCAPPRLYNQIVRQIAEERGLSLMETARLLALVNVAMADAGIALWESKYHYKFWRPVTGIRESDPGTGPTGLGDGNAATIGDATFTPLGAPASNNPTGHDFTPPFPAYPSGHAGFGGAIFEMMRLFFGTDDIAFTFVSDELNGITKDPAGNVRPLIPRSFSSLSQAEEENGQSRIYLGIHWSFDKTEGIALGREVAREVYRSAFTPVPRSGHLQTN